MGPSNRSYDNHRLKVPILLPTGRDARLVADLVEGLRLDAVICKAAEQFLGRIDTESGPFIIGDEALVQGKLVQGLTALLADQPEWSDLPGIVLTGRSNQPRLFAGLASKREIVLMERPVRKSILRDLIKNAVEIRRRQFQIRNLITRMIQTNEKLSSRTTQLQNLTAEMTRVEDRERERIAQMLHDDLQQILASARLQTEMLFDDLNENAQQRVQTVYNILSRAMHSARNLSHELNPMVTRKNRLDQSLNRLARRMSDNYGLNIQTKLEPVDEDISDDIKRFVYRSVQELLFNCVKHAQCDGVFLELSAEPERLIITIADDGVGFDPQSLGISGGNEGGFGLFSIHERASILDGRLEIYSRPDHGSRFLLKMPFSDKHTSASNKEVLEEGY